MKEILIIAYVRPLSENDRMLANALSKFATARAVAFNMPLCMCYRFNTMHSLNDLSYELRSINCAYFMFNITGMKENHKFGLNLPDAAFTAMSIDLTQLPQDKQKNETTSDNIKTMSIDELLDLMNLCGGLEHMPIEAQERLKNLSNDT